MHVREEDAGDVHHAQRRLVQPVIRAVSGVKHCCQPSCAGALTPDVVAKVDREGGAVAGRHGAAAWGELQQMRGLPLHVPSCRQPRRSGRLTKWTVTGLGALVTLRVVLGGVICSSCEGMNGERDRGTAAAFMAVVGSMGVSE